MNLEDKPSFNNNKSRLTDIDNEIQFEEISFNSEADRKDRARFLRQEEEKNSHQFNIDLVLKDDFIKKRGLNYLINNRDSDTHLENYDIHDYSVIRLINIDYNGNNEFNKQCKKDYNDNNSNADFKSLYSLRKDLFVNSLLKLLEKTNTNYEITKSRNSCSNHKDAFNINTSINNNEKDDLYSEIKLTAKEKPRLMKELNAILEDLLNNEEFIKIKHMFLNSSNSNNSEKDNSVNNYHKFKYFILNEILFLYKIKSKHLSNNLRNYKLYRKIKEDSVFGNILLSSNNKDSSNVNLYSNTKISYLKDLKVFYLLDDLVIPEYLFFKLLTKICIKLNELLIKKSVFTINTNEHINFLEKNITEKSSFGFNDEEYYEDSYYSKYEYGDSEYYNNKDIIIEMIPRITDFNINLFNGSILDSKGKIINNNSNCNVQKCNNDNNTRTRTDSDNINSDNIRNPNLNHGSIKEIRVEAKDNKEENLSAMIKNDIYDQVISFFQSLLNYDRLIQLFSECLKEKNLYDIDENDISNNESTKHLHSLDVLFLISKLDKLIIEEVIKLSINEFFNNKENSDLVNQDLKEYLINLSRNSNLKEVFDSYYNEDRKNDPIVSIINKLIKHSINNYFNLAMNLFILSSKPNKLLKLNTNLILTDNYHKNSLNNPALNSVSTSTTHYSFFLIIEAITKINYLDKKLKQSIEYNELMKYYNLHHIDEVILEKINKLEITSLNQRNLLVILIKLKDIIDDILDPLPIRVKIVDEKLMSNEESNKIKFSCIDYFSLIEYLQHISILFINLFDEIFYSGMKMKIFEEDNSLWNNYYSKNDKVSDIENSIKDGSYNSNDNNEEDLFSEEIINKRKRFIKEFEKSFLINEEMNVFLIILTKKLFSEVLDILGSENLIKSVNYMK